MLKAVVSHGGIHPLEPLPLDWPEGQPLRVEKSDDDADGQSFIVPIETLAPEPYVLKRSMQVVVRPADGEFIATLFDANIGMSGDTPEEAVGNLKSLIVDIFEQYESEEASLGRGPARQLAVLRELIQRRA